IVFGALEILFNVPARTAQLQAKRFGWLTMKVCQVAVIRLLGSLGPVDHEPELLQLAMGFFESPSKINLLPSDAGVLSCALGGFPATILPLCCRQRACDLQEIACTLGRLFVHCAVFAFEGGGHFLSPASVFLRGDLQGSHANFKKDRRADSRPLGERESLACEIGP